MRLGPWSRCNIFKQMSNKCYGTRHNNDQHNNVEHDDTQHKGLVCDTQHRQHSEKMTRRITTLSMKCLYVFITYVTFYYCYDKCNYAKCGYVVCLKYVMNKLYLTVFCSKGL
jgi:hypothetical protein